MDKANLAPFIARQKANVFLLDRAGTGLLSGSPGLTIIGGRLCWRLPVTLALPGQGRWAEVGSVDVDAQTGEVLADDALIDDVIRRANRLVANSASI